MLTQEIIDNMIDGSFDENAMFDADPIVGSAMDAAIDEGAYAEDDLLHGSFTFNESIAEMLNVYD